MENKFQKFTRNLKYDPFYKIYKILPYIYGGLMILAGFVFGIIDAFAEITEIGDGLKGGAVFIWLLIGMVAAAIIMWLTMIVISPTIVRTDATIGILEAVKKNGGASYSGNDANNDSEDTLPEL